MAADRQCLWRNASALLGSVVSYLEHDLSVIAEIRDELGHSPRPLAFENSLVADRCATLRVFPEDRKSVSPRMRYAAVAGRVVARLLRMKVPTPPSRI